MKNSRAISFLFLANTISGIAQGISMIAVPWYFSKTLNNGPLFGKIYFILTLITLIWGSYAGTLVDRYSRKNIFLIISITGFVSMGLSYLASSQYEIIPWYLAILPFIITALIYNIHFPNLYALVQEVTEATNYSKITSILEVQGQFSFALSGALASFLLTGIHFESIQLTITPWHLSRVFGVNAIAYLIAFALVWMIKFEAATIRKIDTGTLAERFKMGFTFLLGKKELLIFGIFSLFVFATILVTSTFMMPIYVHQYLKMDGNVYAFSEMFFALGAIMAGFLAARIFKRNFILGVVFLSVVCAIIFSVFALSKTLIIFYSMHLLLGFSNAAIRILRVTYLFENTPNSVIGRANSIFFISNVFWRLVWIGFFSLPFFSADDHIKYCCWWLGAFCLVGAIGVWWAYLKNHKQNK